VNFIIPFRLGDIVRAFFSGRRLKNGVSFTLATVIFEDFIDILVVGFIFLTMAVILPNASVMRNSVIVYGILMIIVVTLSKIAIQFNQYVKVILKSICSVFNDSIKYRLLFFLYSLISTFKNVFVTIPKKKFILCTGCMWTIYMLSYFCLTQAIVFSNTNINFMEIFSLIFSRGGFNIFSSLTEYAPFSLSNQLLLIILLYIAGTLLLLLALSGLLWLIELKVRGRNNQSVSETIWNLLPWINQQDSLRFLEAYFSAGKSDKLRNFIATNRDIQIIKDFSAGSNATTMLAMNDAGTFYRKYAFGNDGEKLYMQFRWLREHAGVLPLPVIVRHQYDDGYCVYDMEYNAMATDLFNFIHYTSSERSWSILEKALDCLRNNLHTTNVRPADLEQVSQYIREKVYANINKIETARELRALLEYDTLVINGEQYHNLKYLERWLNCDFLTQIFSNDIYTDIHGDFTIENLIYLETDQNYPFYFIDPNPGGAHNTFSLDYAKLLQSLHGNYEFLTHISKVQVKQNEIQFIVIESKQYADLYVKYEDYLKQHFSTDEIRSIYFHEVVHWLRLMPYKIEKGSSYAIIFFTGLIKVFNDTVKRYGNALPEKVYRGSKK